MKKEELANLKQRCFFCSERITSKRDRTLEHIIPNSLLKQLSLKDKILEGPLHTQYSRIKVPAHRVCNNNFGSRYESKALQLLENPAVLAAQIMDKADTLPFFNGPSLDNVDVFSIWLTKIYFGLFYHDYLKTKEEDWKHKCETVISQDLFRLTQQSYYFNNAFLVPSSLFVFKSATDNFDLRTQLAPNMICIKIKAYTFILCVGDGGLVKYYLDSKRLTAFKAQLDFIEENNENMEARRHIFAYIETLAIYNSLPKNPFYFYNGYQMTNFSFSGNIPPIEAEKIVAERKYYYKEFMGLAF